MKRASKEILDALASLDSSNRRKAQHPHDPNPDVHSIDFGPDVFKLLEALAEVFVQDTYIFAENLLHHALSETLLAISSKLSADEAAMLQRRLVSDLGMRGYLSLRPILDYSTNLKIPNWAELTNANGVALGHWIHENGVVAITDPGTDVELFSSKNKPDPIQSLDGETLSWPGFNVRPVYLEQVEALSAEDLLKRADILVLGDSLYLYRSDAYDLDLEFSKYSNSHERLLLDKRFTSLFTEVGQESFEPSEKFYATATTGPEGAWFTTGIVVKGYIETQVILSPDERG